MYNQTGESQPYKKRIKVFLGTKFFVSSMWNCTAQILKYEVIIISVIDKLANILNLYSIKGRQRFCKDLKFVLQYEILYYNRLEWVSSHFRKAGPLCQQRLPALPPHLPTADQKYIRKISGHYWERNLSLVSYPDKLYHTKTIGGQRLLYV